MTDYTPSDWAMHYMERYGQIDGAHHKTWVLDQVARILKGTKVKIKIAKWDDGQQECRVDLEKPTKEYRNWVKDMRGKWIKDDDYEGWEYGYDEGIAP